MLYCSSPVSVGETHFAISINMHVAHDVSLLIMSVLKEFDQCLVAICNFST